VKNRRALTSPPGPASALIAESRGEGEPDDWLQRLGLLGLLSSIIERLLLLYSIVRSRMNVAFS